jgi:hypothetical protein
MCEIQKGQRRASTEIVSDIEHLDALIRSVYGRTLDELLNDAVRMGFDHGYEQGRRAGRRLARGKSEFPSTRPGKSPANPGVLSYKLPQATGLVSDIERLNALMRSVYGCTLDELLTEDYRTAYKRGYERGIKAGKRLAKGKPEFPSFGPGTLKSRGAPGALGHKLLRQQFIDCVESLMREGRISLPAAVWRYCHLMSRAWKEVEGAPELRQEQQERQEQQAQLMRLYKRATKPKLALDARPNK